MGTLLRLLLRTEARTFTTYPCLQLKQINKVQNEKETVISGEYINSLRESKVVENKHPSTCILCTTDLNVKHTDVLILSQFLRSDGCMLPKRTTGLCSKQQKRVATLVAMAQKAGLMPNINPPNSKNDPKRRFGWKRYNKYFDESTIKVHLNK